MLKSYLVIQWKVVNAGCDRITNQCKKSANTKEKNIGHYLFHQKYKSNSSYYHPRLSLAIQSHLSSFTTRPNERSETIFRIVGLPQVPFNSSHSFVLKSTQRIHHSTHESHRPVRITNDKSETAPPVAHGGARDAKSSDSREKRRSWPIQQKACGQASRPHLRIPAETDRYLDIPEQAREMVIARRCFVLHSARNSMYSERQKYSYG